MQPIKTNILDLETLTKKYDNLLIQYNQAQIDYANFLNENKNNTTSSSKNFTTVTNAVVFDSNSNITTTNANTLEKCIALCSSNSTCKSATFNPVDYVKPQCWLNKNEGRLISAAGFNNTAIIPKEKELLLIITSLNSQLYDVNNQILRMMKNINNNRPLYNEITQQRYNQFNKLNENLNKLKLERIKLSDKIHQFETLDEEQNYTNLTINKSYYTFLILLLLFCLCIFILGKIIIKTDFQSVGGIRIIFTIIFIVLFVSVILYFNNK
jgi:NADH:ubiquinone oxidoreductase subunit 3 (subunit A)